VSARLTTSVPAGKGTNFRYGGIAFRRNVCPWRLAPPIAAESDPFPEDIALRTWGLCGRSHYWLSNEGAEIRALTYPSEHDGFSAGLAFLDLAGFEGYG
jgi:hypothetical protein